MNYLSVALLIPLLVASTGYCEDAATTPPTSDVDKVAETSAADKADKPAATTEKFSQVQKKMTEEQVFALLGAPTKIEGYESGKRFVPFYFGGDTRRVSWKYDGLGTIIFSKNEYSGRVFVYEVKPEGSAVH